MSPSSVTLGAGGSQGFAATVNNSTNTNVTWTASEGTVSGSGNTVTYTAPIEACSYTFTATSSADATVSATAQISVTGVGVALDPLEVALFREETASFTATVSGVGSEETGVSCSPSRPTRMPVIRSGSSPSPERWGRSPV